MTAYIRIDLISKGNMRKTLVVVLFSMVLAGCSADASAEDALRIELEAANVRIAELEDELAAPVTVLTTTTTTRTTTTEEIAAQGTPENPYPAGTVLELTNDDLSFTVEILSRMDLTEDVDSGLLGSDDPLAPKGQQAVGLQIELRVLDGSLPMRPDDVAGQLRVASQGVLVREGCGLQRYGVGEGLGGLRQPEQVLAGGTVEGWACYRGIDADATGLLYTPIPDGDFWMELPG